MVKPQTARIHGESYVLCTPADSFWKIYVKLEQAHQWNDDLESRIDTDRIERDLLLQKIADQEAELTQLRFLLEASSRRHPSRSRDPGAEHKGLSSRS